MRLSCFNTMGRAFAPFLAVRNTHSASRPSSGQARASAYVSDV
jgi:hypothetical protein